MIVGALGDVVFSVSSRTLKTISNFVWSGSARYATHDLHAGNSISEYTGTDLAKITFDRTDRITIVYPVTICLNIICTIGSTNNSIIA